MRQLFTILVCLVIFGSAVPAKAAAPAGAVSPGASLIGTVSFGTNGVRRDARARRALEDLVPVLRTNGEGKMVRLEGHAGSAKSRADYIKKSLQLAQEVERYLRVEQKVELDLYLAAVDDKIPPRGGHYVRIVVYPQEFKEKYGITQVTGQ